MKQSADDADDVVQARAGVFLGKLAKYISEDKLCELAVELADLAAAARTEGASMGMQFAVGLVDNHPDPAHLKEHLILAAHDLSTAPLPDDEEEE